MDCSDNPQWIVASERLRMKLIIAGSRTLSPTSKQIREVLTDHGWMSRVSEVVSGTAQGVDQAGEDFAMYHGLPIKKFPALWFKHGKRAGILRNEHMGNYADALMAFWDGQSRGTQHMIGYMRKLGKPVRVWNKLEQV